MSKINWAKVIPVSVFFFTLWLLQGALNTLWEAIPTGGGEYPSGNDIWNAYYLMSVSTLVSSWGVAWASYRFNTALYKPKE
ncbi:hypothetical protein [Oricola sp.]|uniref:hypothetical protein n=1 Tax=Oricola sp. TaxID=1979950 RepID=UPI00320BBB6B|nr:hypothetical protein [Oricola sp.]